MRMIDDISEQDQSQSIGIKQPLDKDFCLYLKRNTNARICIGRAGERYNTDTYLRLRADHAIAQDAVWSETDERVIEQLGFLKLTSEVSSRDEYLHFPEKGRQLSEVSKDFIHLGHFPSVDVQIVATDGLNGSAITVNLPEIYPMIMDGLTQAGLQCGKPIFIKYGRVAIMDKISDLFHPKVTCLLVGERPGLSTRASMSAYIAYESSASKPESQRTVISNIYAKGTPAVEAGAQIVSLIKLMIREKKSGVALRMVLEGQ